MPPATLADMNQGPSSGHVPPKRAVNTRDRPGNQLASALVIAALIIGSSLVMTVGGGPTLFGLPAFGLVGFCASVLAGLWLLSSIARRGPRDAE